MNKEEIVLYNKSLGIETVFSSDLDTAGMATGKVIYLNDNLKNVDSLLEKVNRHEVLHFYEDTVQFKKIKQIVLNSLREDELYELRETYYPIYSLLYEDEENIDELIDNEIVINFIIKDREYSVNIDDIVKDCFEVIVSSSNKMTVNKRYLNISLSKKVEQQFPELSKWEKLFVLNYFDGVNHKLEIKSENKYLYVKREIVLALNELYDLCEDRENFRIYYTNNPELDREFEAEINALKTRGNGNEVSRCLANKNNILKEMANKFSESLMAEYTHIVDVIKNSNYEDAFKYLMLKETLSKIYKQEIIDGNSEIIVSKRDMHKSINGHMSLNDVVLDVIYNNLEAYNNFANLYYKGVNKFNNIITEKSEVVIKGLNTFGKGKWIKFDGEYSDRENYIKNSQKLASLVKDTPWCTKKLASIHLSHGDFYVFVDNNNKPHIAVKMNGSQIDEVRGIKNGQAQEIEDDYRDVVLEFLSKNKNIIHGKDWLEKEEWNKRLIEWCYKIDNQSLEVNDLDDLFLDLFKSKDYKSHTKVNSNLIELTKKVNCEYVKRIIALKYNCSEDEIYVGDIFDENRKVDYSLYSVIIGNFKSYNFFSLDGKYDISKLKVVIGDFETFNSDSFLGASNLEMVSGDASFNGVRCESLPKLKYVGGSLKIFNHYIKKVPLLEKVGDELILSCSGVDYFPNLEEVGGDVIFGNNEAIECLPNLKIVGGNVDSDRSSIKYLPKLEIIKRTANFSNSKIFDLSNLIHIGESAHFSNTIIEEIPRLKYIGASAWFCNNKIYNLDSLEEVGWAAHFSGSNLSRLPSLRKVKMNIDLSNTKIKSLPNLQEFGELVSLPNLKLLLYIKKEFSKDKKNYRHIRKNRNITK